MLLYQSHEIDGFRETVKFSTLNADTIKKHTTELVNQLLLNSDFSNIKKEFQTRFIKKSQSSTRSRLKILLDSDNLSTATVFSFNKQINYSLTETENEIILLFFNKSIKFPKYVLSTLIEIINCENFTVQNLKSNIDDSGKLVLCKKLLNEGFILM